MKKTGEKISAMINDSKINDKELSEMMGISIQTVNKWRHGKNVPDIENMYLLCVLLDKKIDDIIVPFDKEGLIHLPFSLGFS